jgi:hypothetical protein
MPKKSGKGKGKAKSVYASAEECMAAYGVRAGDVLVTPLGVEVGPSMHLACFGESVGQF